jgi:hypothetical protein
MFPGDVAMARAFLDQLNAWILRHRLPFYVQLSHGCPEDINAPLPHTFLVSMSEVVRSVFDFLQWRHPIGRAGRRNFLRTFLGEREARTDHEKVFLDWRQQCWSHEKCPGTQPIPTYKNLFSSALKIQGGKKQTQHRDGETEKFFLERILSGDDLAWFENATRDGDDHLEDERTENYIAQMQKQHSYSPSNDEDLMDIQVADHRTYSEYGLDDYGEDDYENNAEQHLDDFGADEPNQDYREG